MVLFVSSVVVAVPSTSFIPPTPANGATTTNKNVEIKVDVTNAADLGNLSWGWNGTNASFYDKSLLLMLNFDNVSAVGDDYVGAYPQLFDASYWSESGLVAFTASAVNDGVLDSAFHTDSSPAGSYLLFDGGATNYSFTSVSITFSGSVYATWNVQYSDDNSAWTTVYTGAGGHPIAVGTYSYSWSPPGEHRYWRLYKTDTAGGGGWHEEVQFSGSKATDLSSYGNNVVMVGNPSLNASGRFGSALSFNGINNYIDMLNQSNFAFTRSQPFTISAWVKTGAANGDIFSKGSLWQPGYDLLLINSNLGFYIDGTFSGGIIAIGTAAPNDNQWHHITATYDGSLVPSGQKIYIDGTDSSAATIDNGVLSVDPVNNYDALIGYSPGWNYYLNGSIDEVRVWNRSLSASQVKQQYLSNLRKYDSDKWEFYSDQTNLSVGTTYTYFATAADTSGNTNSTETRTITIRALMNAVPEFGTWALLLALGLVAGGIAMMRKK